jgi:hypothetical protein
MESMARRIGMSWRDRTTRYYDGISLDLFAVTRA